MADFNPAFDKTVLNEGGFKLTNVEHDRGGMTYAGISRKYHPSWAGWEFIDRGETPATALVRKFYKEEFWDRICGDEIADQGTAEDIFDFGVNADYRVATKLAQIVVGAAPDGAFGRKTLEAINAVDPIGFNHAFALAKLARYRDIITKDKTQLKFITGWINRLLKGVR